MLKEKHKHFYLVSKEIIPEAILKTAMAKEILQRGEAFTVNEAVEKVGLSRSAFYKYRDGVFPFYETGKEKIITLSLILEHKPGVLSDVLNTVAAMKGNVLTINQGLPLQNLANTTLSIETRELEDEPAALISKLRSLRGVKKVEIVGQSKEAE
ncbi:MAG TPA: ACT domain-containing protein [Peptococcaceae bacterium]|jgi:chorismate mutase|nr:ACT domain-containing protein [Peptococcaceae bacterium]